MAVITGNAALDVTGTLARRNRIVVTAKTVTWRPLEQALAMTIGTLYRLVRTGQDITCQKMVEGSGRFCLNWHYMPCQNGKHHYQ